MLNMVLAEKMERSENKETDIGMCGRTVCLEAQDGQGVETEVMVEQGAQSSGVITKGFTRARWEPLQS